LRDATLCLSLALKLSSCLVDELRAHRVCGLLVKSINQFSNRCSIGNLVKLRSLLISH
jgi:hypothetical protein